MTKRSRVKWRLRTRKSTVRSIRGPSRKRKENIPCENCNRKINGVAYMSRGSYYCKKCIVDFTNGLVLENVQEEAGING